MVTSDTIRVALIVAEALEDCGVRYLVGGSLASAVSGEPRSTVDVDLVVEPLTSLLGDRFHADADVIRRAIRDRSSANIIHQATSTMERRQRVKVSSDPA